jgi:lon-related putative ATP-dependent protease
MSDKKHKTLGPDKLRWRCDLNNLQCEPGFEIKMCPDIIGQCRAVNALRLGFDIESQGYNIFVNGMVGTGRKTAIKCLLEETKRIKRIPDDKLYVHNFSNPDKPKLIRLPAGKGKKIKKDLEDFLEYLTHTIPAVFESEDYQGQKKEVIEDLNGKQKKIIKGFESEIRKENFTLIQMQIGTVTRPAILPVVDGKPVNFDQLNTRVAEGKLSKKQLAEMEKKHAEFSDKLDAIFKKLRDLEKVGNEKLKALEKEMVTPLVGIRIDEIKSSYQSEKINEYLDQVKESVLDNLGNFIKKTEGQEQGFLGVPVEEKDPFLEYRINLLVDNSGAKRAPVIFETSPTYANLFGTVEVTPSRYGFSKTDFTRIKAGSILQADGGFLVVEALDLLIEPGVWPAFKRTLRNRKLEIQTYSSIYMISFSGMKPEPVEIDVKVAMVGDSFLYHILYTRDEDFKKIFKLRADFDSVMTVNEESLMDYQNFVNRIVGAEKLQNFDQKAIARVVEFGVRLAGKQNKLSTQFNKVADILREANYFARKDKSSIVTEKYVQKAIDEKKDRSRLVEEKIQEMIAEGSIMIDTRGGIVGQVNGLSVYDLGDYAFGKPSRITANVSVGEAGIINIEREAELSGRIHDKGVLIITGYLRARFAQNKPLAVSASLCFEQSYSGVEGDSASSTEVYALLSSLSGLPIRQGIAVTGSLNQKGEIQPIGGVNQKIEGFYQVCLAQGLTGDQGVIIPHQNVTDLMLNEEVVGAVSRGKFHIYPVETIEQGIEILTGVKAGKLNADGSYEKDSVFNLADKKLQEFADIWKSYQ